MQIDNTNMSIEEFAAAVCTEIRKYLPEEYRSADIKVKEILKANDTRLHGIEVRLPDEIMSPLIYMEGFYDRFRSGELFESIVQDVANFRVETSVRDNQGENVIDIINNFDQAKHNLIIEIGNTEWNKEREKGFVKRQIGEFTETYRVKIKTDDGWRSIKVDEELRKYWGKTEEEIHEAAVFASEMRKPVLCTMEDAMKNTLKNSPVTNLLENPGAHYRTDIPMLMLSTEDKIYGSALMLREDILKKAAEVMDDSFYILPSSIHEVLLVPAGSSGMDPLDLEEMVITINQNEVEPEERLSNHVHYYNSTKRSLTSITTGVIIQSKDLDTLDNLKSMVAKHIANNVISAGDMNNSPAKRPKKKSR